MVLIMHGTLSTMNGNPLLSGGGRDVLVVSEDPDATDLLAAALKLADYRVATVGSGAEALLRIAEHRYDLVVWDAMLPDMDRYARGRRRAPADRPPVLFLTTCDWLPTLAPELGVGAEDYVTKPVRITEVLARARALLRDRNPGRSDGTPRHGDLVLDDGTCQARRGARPLGLTPAEYRLLGHLLANAGRVLSKEQISRHVWGELRGTPAIEKLVSRLRSKVDLEDPALIHTHRGFGYRLGG